jgi:hypothetical protein
MICSSYKFFKRHSLLLLLLLFFKTTILKDSLTHAQEISICLGDERKQSPQENYIFKTNFQIKTNTYQKLVGQNPSDACRTNQINFK